MAEVSYTIPRSVNFIRLRAPQVASITVDPPASQQNPALEHLRRYRTVEGFINHKLYHRYASSQNYYYLKDINHILTEERSSSLITYKDQMALLTSDELLKKYYKMKDYQGKVSKLCEYYKFHKEIPRIFAKEVYDTFFDHHDQKRKVEFVVITKKLREEAGEDVKGELEVALKKIRDTPFEPMITADLCIQTGYKKGGLDDRKKQKGLNQSSHTMSNLQNKLSEIFANGENSISELRLATLADEGPTEFAKFLTSQVAPSNPMPSTSRFTILNSDRAQTIFEANPPMRVPQPKKFTHSIIKAALAPEIVENLKKISLPERSSVTKKNSLIKTKEKEESVSIKPKGRNLQKAFTREPSKAIMTREPSQTATSRNKSSSSITRGLTLIKKTTEESSPLMFASSKKEYPEFRITKKGTFELESSLRKSTDRKEPTLFNSEAESSQRGLPSWQGSKAVLKRVPSTASKGSFHHEMTERPPKKTDIDVRLKGSSPSGDLGFSFKVDIERLLKASGIMDYKPTKGHTISRAVVPTLSGPSGSTAKHKYNNSAPDTLKNFGTLSKPVSLQVTTKNSFSKSRAPHSSTQVGVEIVSGRKIPLIEPKPYLIEPSTFGQQNVKLVKKTSHNKKGSNRF